MSLVTNGMGGASSSSIVGFTINIKKVGFGIKNIKQTFSTKPNIIKFKIKEVEK